MFYLLIVAGVWIIGGQFGWLGDVKFWFYDGYILEKKKKKSKSYDSYMTDIAIT